MKNFAKLLFARAGVSLISLNKSKNHCDCGGFTI